MADEGSPIRIAAYADVHAHAELRGRLRQELGSVNGQADALVLAGDLTLYGTVDEAKILVEELQAVQIPMIGVLGNHDYEMGQESEIRDVLADAGVTMLDGGIAILRCHGERVGFTGVKGFGGGFGDRLVAPFGEEALKSFVRAGQIETEKLSQGLHHLRLADPVDHVVSIIHYAPIRDTILGEPMDLWPYLGNSSLSEPIDRYAADVVFHGHAHYGSPFGRTGGGVPVYNVARPLVHNIVIHFLNARPAKVQV